MTAGQSSAILFVPWDSQKSCNRPSKNLHNESGIKSWTSYVQQSYNRKRRETKCAANSFCSIRQKWPPADVLTKTISYRYVVKCQAKLLTMIFLKQFPNPPSRKWGKKKIQQTNQPIQTRLKLYFIFPPLNQTEPELLSWGIELPPEPAVAISVKTEHQLLKNISKPNLFWMAELP